MPRAKECNVGCNSLNHFITIVNIRQEVRTEKAFSYSQSNYFLHENLVYSKAVS
jgi:hypothetical protein